MATTQCRTAAVSRPRSKEIRRSLTAGSVSFNDGTRHTRHADHRLDAACSSTYPAFAADVLAGDGAELLAVNGFLKYNSTPCVVGWAGFWSSAFVEVSSSCRAYGVDASAPAPPQCLSNSDVHGLPGSWHWSAKHKELRDNFSHSARRPHLNLSYVAQLGLPANISRMCSIHVRFGDGGKLKGYPTLLADYQVSG